MKKVVRIFGLLLVLGVILVSCDPQGGEIDDTPDVTEASIKGSYAYHVVLVDKAIDSDKDGVFNSNLMVEKGKECVWDNIWEFTETKAILHDKGAKCKGDTEAIILTAFYTLDKDNKTITLKDDKGTVIDILINVKLKYDDYSKTTRLEFSIFDKPINQLVTYVFEKQK